MVLMKQELSLLQAESADVASIQELVRAAYSPYIERIGRKPAPMAANYELAVRNGTIVVAKAGVRVVGLLMTRPVEGTLLIENIAVHPDTQGLGVGSALLQHAEAEARERGITRLSLYTNARMTENLDYYPRRGFREIDRRTVDGFDRVFFERALE